jgi:hypothetical protein
MKSATDECDFSAITSAYLHLADKRLPGRISGLYLVGSVALDDYRRGQSDVDFVAVSEAAFGPLELEQLGRLHREMRRMIPRPNLDGVYVTWDELQADPASLSVPFYRDGRFASSGGFAANPVTWYILQRFGIAVRGPVKPVVRHDDALLRRWCRENLQSYWAGWVHRARTHPIRRLYSLTRQATVWGVLGVTRLHATLRTGKVFSKTAAGSYALRVFPPRWSVVIKEASGSRSGRAAVSYRNIFERRREALAFMEYVIADALQP